MDRGGAAISEGPAAPLQGTTYPSSKHPLFFALLGGFPWLAAEYLGRSLVAQGLMRPARLDVAVALPPPDRKPGVSPPEYVTTSGQITAIGYDLDRRVQIVPNSSSYSKGC